MSNAYEHLSKEELIEILRRRDAVSSYGLVWERKDIERERALNRDFVGLTLDPEASCGAGPWENLIIEGDNYDALRALATHYAGQVQLIYIDPPYNTGRRDFVYNDRFFDTNDRFRHSVWIEFMHQRLVLARDLLAEDGAIFVSIDDNELFNLGLVMNQVFGEQAFVANCIWQKRYSRENREAIGDAHEYLLVYAPNPDRFKLRRGRIPLSEAQAKVYRNPDNPKETDPQKRWQSVTMTAQGYRPNQMYEIVAPNGTRHLPPEGRCWSMTEPEYKRLEEAGRITFGKDGNGVPRMIRYLSEVDGLVPWTWWPHDEVGHTDEARKEVQAIFGTQTAFDTPKPLRLMRRVLEIGAPEKDALVLDFFAGSGTLGQAVLEQNQADGGSRRFILVSSREATADAPEKNLCRDICAFRVRKAAEAVGSSFAYLRASRVPMHRLEDRLSDAMVWTHALMMAGHPVTPTQGTVNISTRAEQLLVYCTNTKPATLRKLRFVLEAHVGVVAVFTWAPAAIKGLIDDLGRPATVVSVPEDLRRIFRQGSPVIADKELTTGDMA